MSGWIKSGNEKSKNQTNGAREKIFYSGAQAFITNKSVKIFLILWFLHYTSVAGFLFIKYFVFSKLYRVTTVLLNALRNCEIWKGVNMFNKPV